MKIKHIRKYHLLYSKSEQLIITNRFEKKKPFESHSFHLINLLKCFFFYFLKKTNKNLYYLQKIEQHTKK